MPFRHAHWWVLLLFLLVGVAFWQNYLSVLATSPIEYHLHGVSASLWLVLLALQSWSIHSGRRAFHRTNGLVSFALFPFFLAGGVLVLVAEAQHFVDQVSPFYRLYPPRLAWIDFVAVGGMAWFYYQALRWRRNPARHGGYMLATAIFLLPPILGRLAPGPLGIDLGTPAGFDELGKAFHAGNIVTAAIALLIGWRARKGGRPFVIAAVLTLVSSLLFEVPGGTRWWFDIFAYFAVLPWGPTAAAAVAAGLAVGWAGWTAGKRPVAPGGAARPGKAAA